VQPSVRDRELEEVAQPRDRLADAAAAREVEFFVEDQDGAVQVCPSTAEQLATAVDGVRSVLMRRRTRATHVGVVLGPAREQRVEELGERRVAFSGCLDLQQQQVRRALAARQTGPHTSTVNGGRGPRKQHLKRTSSARAGRT